MSSTAELPLPVASLLRRAVNAKSAKDCHDYAFSAWEASVRLALAYHPPGDTTGDKLVAPTLGHWVSCWAIEDKQVRTDALAALHELFDEVLQRPSSQRKRLTYRGLINGLPAYRNRVLAHGSPRTNAFYVRAGQLLTKALEAAWNEDMFIPPGARMVVVDEVAVDSEGGRSVRLLDLTGFRPVAMPQHEGPLPGDVARQRVYLRWEGKLHPLFPWVVFVDDDVVERVFFYHRLGDGPEYLDFESGELLRGSALAAKGPGVAEAMMLVLGRSEADIAYTDAAASDSEGDYEILDELGSGGMGIVSLARQRTLERLVALKIIRTELAQDDAALHRFRREVRALARADHPHVVKIIAAGELGGRPFYAMELVEGADLASVGRLVRTTGSLAQAVHEGSAKIRSARRAALGKELDDEPSERGTTEARSSDNPTVRQLAEAFRDAASALSHLHELGIVHRDVKPTNLMIGARDLRVVLMDLGLAAFGDATQGLTRDAALLGTIRYMPPERLARGGSTRDPRSDIYSLGASFYEVLCGSPVHDGETEANVASQIVVGVPKPPQQVNPELPADLAAILMMTLEKDPRRRYASAQALRTDLQAFLDGRKVLARPLTAWYRLRLAAARHRVAVLWSLALVVSLTIGGGMTQAVNRCTLGTAAPHDWGFVDTAGGDGWSKRCSNWLNEGKLQCAAVACRRGLEMTRSAKIAADIAYKQGRIAEARGDLPSAIDAYARSERSEPRISAHATLERLQGRTDDQLAAICTPSGFAVVTKRAAAGGLVRQLPSIATNRLGTIAPGTRVKVLRIRTLADDGRPDVWCEVETKIKKQPARGWMHGDILASSP